MKKLKDFFIKNKILIIAVFICIVTFTVAFFAGGNLSSDNPTAKPAAKSFSCTTSVTPESTVQTSTAADKKNKSKANADKNTKDKDNKSSDNKGNANKSATAAQSQNKNSVTNKNTGKSNSEKSNKEKSESSAADNKKPSATSAASNKKPSANKNTSSSSKKDDVQPTTQDKYKTDPVPSGKPEPVEPQEKETTDTSLYCTFTITCSTILDNMDDLDPDKKELVPDDGIILKKQKVKFTEGESVYDVLVRVCKDNKIHMESSWTPMYNSAYIEGIHNLYEFDCGSLSGWMYKVNEWFPNYGCSRYQLKGGDDVVWCYTCNLGYDVGGGYATGE